MKSPHASTVDASRRQLLAAGAAGMLGGMAGRASGPAHAATQDATTTATTGPTTAPEPGRDEIGIAARLLGRDYRPEEIELMRSGLVRYHEAAHRLRTLEMPPSVESATHFDPVLNHDGLPRGDGSLTFKPPADVTYDGDIRSLAFAPIPKLAALLRSGKVTSVELTRTCIDRLKQHDPTLLCVVNLTEARAMEAAKRADAELAAGKDRGPLHGIPYGAKDLLSAAGTPTTYGISQYRDQVFDEDATVVARLEEAGAVLVAKLTLGELAMGDVWYGGTTRNPWNPRQGSSGSSAGSCSAVAAGLVPFAIGSETLGSIVSPAVRCGVSGLRPTYGRVPRTGAMSLSRTMDKLGPIARGIEDLALVLHAISGPDGHDRTCHDFAFNWPGPQTESVRVGYDKIAFDEIGTSSSEDVKSLYSGALERCRSIFGELKPVELPQSPLHRTTVMLTIHTEAAEAFEELIQADTLRDLAQQDAGSWPNVFRKAGFMPAVDYHRAQRYRRLLMDQMALAMGELDAYITVPLRGPGPTLTNLCGWPCSVGRLGVVATDEGPRPYQVEFVGRPYGEAALLAAAQAFESVASDVDRWPDTFTPA